MFKRTLFFALCLMVILNLSGCGEKEVTLHLCFGDRTGVYSGELNSDQRPNGQGKFTTTDDSGSEWTYEGEFKDGHFEGQGKITRENGTEEIGLYVNDYIVPMDKEETNRMFSSPADYMNHCVELTGVVFTPPEYYEGCFSVQMMADIKNFDQNTLLFIPDEESQVSDGDYLHITGFVFDIYHGENAYGGTLNIPAISVTECEVLDYVDAVAPTLAEYEIDETVTQKGYSVTLQKVELAENETRVYVRVENNGRGRFSLYGFDSYITQEGQQFAEQINWEAEYPEIQTDLLSGNYSEGIIVFPPISEQNFKVTFGAYSDRWEENLSPFVFEICISE